MYEDANHRYARRRLEDLALKVEEVPSAAGKLRADYIAYDGSSSYIVEVKGPGEDDSFAEDLARRGTATRIQLDARTNPLSKKIRKAAKQLEATPAPESAFRVVALVTGERDIRLRASQYVATLYGIESLFSLEDENPRAPPSCYYSTFNEFFELRAVEAPMFLTPSGSTLRPNTFANRYDQFTESELYAIHRRNNAVQDPLVSEKAGETFIADTDLDRHDENQMLDFIQAQYSLQSRPFVIRLQQIEQQVVIGNDKAEGEEQV